jgi:hypothetical protein
VYTFCFVQASSSDEAEQLCRRAVSAVSASLPTLGSPPRVECVVIAELRAAFATLRPEVDVTPSLIQHHEAAGLTAITFGVQPGAANVAAAVLETYRRTGIAGVAEAEGNYSALVLDRDTRSIWLAGTLLGHRSLFHHAAPGLLVVSPHDLTMIGTGRVPVTFDPITLASMAACDWSLGGRSLAAGIARCHPLEALRWRDGALTRHPLPHPLEAERIDPRDRVGLRQQVDRVAAGMMDFVERQVRGQARVPCSLTAGMDSRAVFAALCGARGGAAIDTVTTGGERSLDVTVARRLARAAGATHERQEPEPPTADDFMGSTRLRAFFCSGDTNAKRAMSKLPRLRPGITWKAGGTGGEIYRGFFYQYFGVTGVAPKGTPELAERLLTWRFRRLGRLPFADPSSGAGVRERLLDALAIAERCSRDPYDMADLLYLFERYGRWGAASTVLPWQRGWTPFESIRAIRAAFRLPPPIGKRCLVHAALVERYLPASAYWTPINGGQLLALEGDDRIRYALRQALNGSSLVLQTVRRKLLAGARRGDDIKSDYLAGPLRDVSRDMLLEEGSLSQAVFGRSGVQQLLDAAPRDGLAVIGILLTAEAWRKLARELTRDGTSPSN